MTGFRHTYQHIQRASQMINSTRTNATLRDLDEEEGELEEKEGTIVSIKQDLINGTGWTVKDKEGQTYLCSCAASMYDLPETKERHGILYPTDTVKVRFQINPILRVNTITEILSLGEETNTLDISKWKHGDESTTVIAKPKSAISMSNGFITMNYDNNNQVIANNDGVSTEGKNTNINTNNLNINTKNVSVQGKPLLSMIDEQALNVSNEYMSFHLNTPPNMSVMLDKSNNVTQLSINAKDFEGYGVIGEIKEQKIIPVREQAQQLITDGNCTDIIKISTDGVISIEPFQSGQQCHASRNISSTNNWISPQTTRNYIKVIVQETCDYCDEGTNTSMEYINYCPACQEFDVLSNTSTSIRCNKCNVQYCQNCGTNITQPSNEKLKKYNDNYISTYGTTCKYCKTQLQPDTNKQYVNYCPNCKKWNILYQSEIEQDDNIINILECEYCNSIFCSTCGIDQDKHGLTLNQSPASYENYDKAFRRLKYIRDGI